MARSAVEGISQFSRSPKYWFLGGETVDESGYYISSTSLSAGGALTFCFFEGEGASAAATGRDMAGRIGSGSVEFKLGTQPGSIL